MSAKRAACVAIVGDHPVTFIGGELAAMLANLVDTYTHGLATYLPVCGCGNHHENDVLCICSYDALAKCRKAGANALSGQLTIAVRRWSPLEFYLPGCVRPRRIDISHVPLEIELTSSYLIEKAQRAWNGIDRDLTIAYARTLAAITRRERITIFNVTEALDYKAAWPGAGKINVLYDERTWDDDHD